ncbi:NADPH-dependent FMN reductase [Cytobacillus oceanisediminis]|uniref:NADPH-dependent FMN reductase n=1 Tax=Bacillaceae TaxID=186817 RepID=UPI001CCC5B22|nr:NADPH-dependent FMN reductase [Cytobacillus oceanisediminis]MBZ9532955.1 NADPH-dependent FMN reductase [Cytobacillus oceanisediminis]
MKTVTIIAGGHKINSRLTGILQFAADFLRQKQVNVQVIQVHQLPSDALITADFMNQDIVEARQKVEQSDGVIVLSPVFQASYSGIIKTFLDLLPQKSLRNKNILPLMLGGTYAHLLVMDYALKPVLANLGATNILRGAYVTDNQITEQDNQTYLLDTDSETRITNQLEQLLKGLYKIQ